MNKNICILFSLILFSFCQVVSAAPKEEVLDSVVAVVNSEVITESQVKNEMIDMQTMMEMQRIQNGAAEKPMSAAVLRESAIQNLIDRSLQMQYAKKVNVEITEEIIDQTIKQLATQNNMDLEAFTQALNSQGMTIEEYRKKIRRQLTERELKQKVVAPRVKMTDEEVKVAMNDPNNPVNLNRQYLVQDYLIEVSEDADKQILAKAKTLAEKTYALVKQGKLPNMEEVEFNDLGWRRLPELPKSFIKVVKTMKKGDTHEPFILPNGYHVLHLADVQAPYQDAKGYEFKIRHLLMKPTALLTDSLVKQELTKIKKEAEQGTPFSKLARKYSEDYDTAPNGGDMGWLKQRDLPAAFKQPVSDLRKGQVSAPFQSQNGWHLLYIEDVREKEDSQAMIEQETRSWLFQQKMVEESEAWLTQLRQNTFIKREDGGSQTSAANNKASNDKAVSAAASNTTKNS